MRIKMMLLMFVCGGLLWSTPDLATATHPVRLFEYTFAPDHSRLHVAGGFAGINDRYGIEGTFGVVLDRPHVVPHPTLHPDLLPPDNNVHARFVNVDARLVGDGILSGTSLDGFLNMTGWEGRLIPFIQPASLDRPHRIRWKGHDGQGLDIFARSALADRGFKIWGTNRRVHRDDGTISNGTVRDGTRPDGTCCDFFSWRLSAAARPSHLDSVVPEPAGALLLLVGAVTGLLAYQRSL